MKDHQCMARNKDNTARCERRSTKMLPTSGDLIWNDQTWTVEEGTPTVPTLRICGICLRRLHSWSSGGALSLELDNHEHHLVVKSGDVLRTRREGSDWE